MEMFDVLSKHLHFSFNPELQNGLNIVHNAAASHHDGKVREAFISYRIGLRKLTNVMKGMPDGDERVRLRIVIKHYLSKAESVKNSFIATKQVPPSLTRAVPSTDVEEFGSTDAVGLSVPMDGWDEQLYKEVVTTEKPTTDSLSHLYLSDGLREMLVERVVLPIRFPHLFSGSRRFQNSLMLFGPEGGDQQEVLRAAAADANGLLVTLDLATLVKRGRRPQIVKKMFSEHAHNASCVIHVRDLDTCSGDYHSDDQLRRFLAEVLVGINGVGYKATVVTSTSRPWLLASHIRRRCGVKVYVGPPSQEQKFEFLKHFLKDVPGFAVDDDLRRVVELCDRGGFKVLRAAVERYAAVPSPTTDSMSAKGSPQSAAELTEITASHSATEVLCGLVTEELKHVPITTAGDEERFAEFIRDFDTRIY